MRYTHGVGEELVASIEVVAPSGYPTRHDVLISHKVTERRALPSCAAAQDITLLRKHSRMIRNGTPLTPSSLMKYGALVMGDEIFGTSTIGERPRWYGLIFLTTLQKRRYLPGLIVHLDRGRSKPVTRNPAMPPTFELS